MVLPPSPGGLTDICHHCQHDLYRTNWTWMYIMILIFHGYIYIYLYRAPHEIGYPMPISQLMSISSKHPSDSLCPWTPIRSTHSHGRWELLKELPRRNQSGGGPTTDSSQELPCLTNVTLQRRVGSQRWSRPSPSLENHHTLEQRSWKTHSTGLIFFIVGICDVI